MFAKRNVQHAQEYLKWLVIFAIAGATTVWAYNAVSGGETLKTPRLLPQQIDQTAQPLINDFDPSLQSNLTDSPPSINLLASVHLWDAFKQHENLELNEALNYWQEARLSYNAEVWRYVAQADIYMRQLKLNDMMWALEEAEKLDDNNAVVHFYYGQLHLLQAEGSEDWPEDLGTYSRMRLVSTEPQMTMPLTRNMYLLMAAQRLELAIMEEPEVALATPLVDWDDDLQRVLAPNVEDLLAVTGNQNYVGKAHLQLSEIWTQRYNLQRAEAHVDAARQREMPVSDNYIQLAKHYEQQDAHGDAVRVYAKAMTAGSGIIAPLNKIIENVQESVKSMNY